MTLILCVLENSCPKRQARALPTWFSKAEKSVFQISFTLYLCFEKVEQDFFFRENKFKQTPFASIWRFFYGSAND